MDAELGLRERQDLPGRSAGEVGVLLQQLRKRDCDPERDEGKVDAGQPHRRNADEQSSDARDDTGDRNRPDVTDAVVDAEDRRRVAADGHERAVPERDLAAVPREDREAEQRDEIDADRGEPAIAPTTAASPQPSANIQPTRTPTSLDESGFSDAARSARPTFVNRKKTASNTTRTISTATIPMYWMLMCAPAILTVRVEKPPLNVRSAPPQITLTRPFRTSARPCVTIAADTTGPRSNGRISVRSMPIPPTNAITSTIGNAAQKLRPWFISDHAMNVVKVAISPWAKLIAPVVRKIRTSASARLA